MFERIISKIKTGKTKSLGEKQNDALSRFIENPFHNWIKSDKIIHRAFSILFSSMPDNVLLHFQKKILICLKASGQQACTLTPPSNSEIIIIFPDLEKLLKSASPFHGIAVLAHEIGHIIHNHSNMVINPIKAQIEADTIAHEMGFGKELLEQLLSFPETHEYNLRIRYLHSLLREI
ncbi:MAG: hypothetical protein KAQ98_07390 [Bacteriovoracaceae bacterium]|nr:hypothetical protein [Bacteriovoracaceae bacterium]